MEYSEGPGWIGVDFDGTLARYEGWATNGTDLGTPIPLMLERVKRWLAQGVQVKIVTARAASNSRNRYLDINRIHDWCRKYIGIPLEVTAEKDFNMVALWDDRAVGVEANRGFSDIIHETDPLGPGEEFDIFFEGDKDGR
jgi:hypothetical protein